MIIKQALYRHGALPVLEKGMETYAARGKASANNLANITTPHYRKIKVNFEETLKQALDLNGLRGTRTDAGHLSLGRPNLLEVGPDTYRPDDPTLPGEINNVDVDMEASAQAEAEMKFYYAVSLHKHETDALRAAATGKAQK